MLYSDSWIFCHRAHQLKISTFERLIAQRLSLLCLFVCLSECLRGVYLILTQGSFRCYSFFATVIIKMRWNKRHVVHFISRIGTDSNPVRFLQLFRTTGRISLSPAIAFSVTQAYKSLKLGTSTEP